MSPTEAAWLAGFFDGEGSLTAYMAGRGRRYKTWSLVISNTNEQALQFCTQISGCGMVSAKREADEKRKKQWAWRVNSKRDVHALLSQMLPYLQVKRPVGLEVLTELADHLADAA